LIEKEEAFCAGHLTIAETVNNIAESYRMIGNYEKACEMYEKSIKMLWKKKNDYKPFLAQVYNNMGITYKCLDKKK
jgi:hypothetical protein